MCASSKLHVAGGAAEAHEQIGGASRGGEGGAGADAHKCGMASHPVKGQITGKRDWPNPPPFRWQQSCKDAKVVVPLSYYLFDL